MHLYFEKKSQFLLFSNFGKDITFDVTDDIQQKIISQFDEHHLDVYLDFTEVNYIDSNGIGMISGLARHIGENGHRIYIINCSATVFRLFELFKLDMIVKFAKDDSLLKKNTEENTHVVYIIEDGLSAEQKNKIRETAGRECIFLSGRNVDIEKILQEHETNIHQGPASRFLKMRTSEEVIAHLSDGFSIEIIESIILQHSNPAVRKDAILFSAGCLSAEEYEKILQKILHSEKEKDVLTAAAYVADELKKKNRDS